MNCGNVTQSPDRTDPPAESTMISKCDEDFARETFDCFITSGKPFRSHRNFTSAELDCIVHATEKHQRCVNKTTLPQDQDDNHLRHSSEEEDATQEATSTPLSGPPGEAFEMECHAQLERCSERIETDLLGDIRACSTRTKRSSTGSDDLIEQCKTRAVIRSRRSKMMCSLQMRQCLEDGKKQMEDEDESVTCRGDCQKEVDGCSTFCTAQMSTVCIPQCMRTQSPHPNDTSTEVILFADSPVHSLKNLTAVLNSTTVDPNTLYSGQPGFQPKLTNMRKAGSRAARYPTSKESDLRKRTENSGPNMPLTNNPGFKVFGQDVQKKEDNLSVKQGTAPRSKKPAKDKGSPAPYIIMCSGFCLQQWDACVGECHMADDACRNECTTYGL
ncbi:hypothetical protein BLNAU_7571 [Blattamonas nauphoetae]|uniref:Uncharacterized protein n=1 Tax=Blattamonas nauphoetae TaxID=2049346 RepID=A0ABQ9Y110_9EUKA|nr:hypothetical protein BLNAU_7571 [Blattamonas nauphoetae]